MCTPYYDSEVIKNLFFLQELYENDGDSDILSNCENYPFNNFEGRKHKNDYINHNRIFKEIFTPPLQTEENYITSLIINQPKEGTYQTSKYENKENNQTPPDIQTELFFITGGKESQVEPEVVKANSVPTTPLNEKNINYLFTKIKNIFVKKNFAEQLIALFENNKDNITFNMTKGISLFIVKNKELNKRNRNRNNQNKVEKKEVVKVKMGRKKQKNKKEGEGKHKKDSPDNIIKKIKALFFNCLIEYTEQFLNQYKKNYEDKIKLLKLDYEKYINKLKKDADLELLKKPLKDVVSLDTSKRYPKINDIYWNKKIIQKIIEKEKDNKEINDLLNMSFNDWINIFTYKNDWEYNITFNKLQNYLLELTKNNDEEYITKFILYLYNYKMWFENKKPKKPKKNKIKSK